MMDSAKKNEAEELMEIDIQIFALILFIVVSIIGIYIQIRERQDLLKILESDPADIRKLEIVVAIILVTVRLYLFYLDYKSYKEDPTKYNANYALGSLLILIGTVIILFTLIKEPVGIQYPPLNF